MEGEMAELFAWRNMSSAPKDGTEVEIQTATGSAFAVYLSRKDIWVSPDGAEGYDPLAWRPKSNA